MCIYIYTLVFRLCIAFTPQRNAKKSLKSSQIEERQGWMFKSFFQRDMETPATKHPKSRWQKVTSAMIKCLDLVDFSNQKNLPSQKKKIQFGYFGYWLSPLARANLRTKINVSDAGGTAPWIQMINWNDRTDRWSFYVQPNPHDWIWLADYSANQQT